MNIKIVYNVLPIVQIADFLPVAVKTVPYMFGTYPIIDANLFFEGMQVVSGAFHIVQMVN